MTENPSINDRQNQAMLRLQIKNILAIRGSWTEQEEDDFVEVLINYGVWNRSANHKIDLKWTKFRGKKTSLEQKSDGQMNENLYCILARCSKIFKSPIGELDEFRAEFASRVSEKTCNIIMQRITLMRKVHIHQMTKAVEFLRIPIRMMPLDNMPNGWTHEHDEKLFYVVDKFGINQIKKKLAILLEFRKIDLPENKQLFHRLFEIICTIDNGKYISVINLTLDDETDDDCENELSLLAIENAKKLPLMSSLLMENLTSNVSSMAIKEDKEAIVVNFIEKGDSKNELSIGNAEMPNNNRKIFNIAEDDFEMINADDCQA